LAIIRLPFGEIRLAVVALARRCSSFAGGDLRQPPSPRRWDVPVLCMQAGSTSSPMQPDVCSRTRRWGLPRRAVTTRSH
jgi:hypothetical protein